jgi:regulator of sigma E protease
LIIFSLIIIIHEFGHFLFAKLNGICVLEFSLGLGPTLIGFTKGETKYSLKLLPFGGACMMLGEDEDSEDERAFGKQSVWARISVVAAGPVFNFLLAFVLALILLFCNGVDQPIITDVTDGYAAQQAGMQAGDEIVKINGHRIRLYREVTLYSYFHEDEMKETLTVTYKRDGQLYEAALTPTYDEESGRYLLGVMYDYSRVRPGVIKTIGYSFYEVKYWISTTLGSLRMLVTGKVSAGDISGPVGIVSAIGDTYEESIAVSLYAAFLSMVNFSIMLTANLGVMNLLPLPALDGGRLVFLIIEAIRGKRVNPDKDGMVHFIGLVVLLGLMVVIMFNDIRNLF